MNSKLQYLSANPRRLMSMAVSAPAAPEEKSNNKIDSLFLYVTECDLSLVVQQLLLTYAGGSVHSS